MIGLKTYQLHYTILKMLYLPLKYPNVAFANLLVSLLCHKGIKLVSELLALQSSIFPESLDPRSVSILIMKS